MRIHYDPIEDAMYIRLSEDAYVESDAVRDGVILDLDHSGRVVGIELLDVSEKFPNVNPHELKYEVRPAPAR